MDKKRILLVEDSETLRKLVAQRLRTCNYEVLQAGDGAEGLAKALSDRPDLIVSDVMMPNMDGYTFVKKLRATPALAHIPVIMLTAKEEVKELFILEGVGQLDYIVKPFESETLTKKMEELLGRMKAHLEEPPEPPPPPSS